MCLTVASRRACGCVTAPVQPEDGVRCTQGAVRAQGRVELERRAWARLYPQGEPVFRCGHAGPGAACEWCLRRALWRETEPARPVVVQDFGRPANGFGRRSARTWLALAFWLSVVIMGARSGDLMAWRPSRQDVRNWWAADLHEMGGPCRVGTPLERVYKGSGRWDALRCETQSLPNRPDPKAV